MIKILSKDLKWHKINGQYTTEQFLKGTKEVLKGEAVVSDVYTGSSYTTNGKPSSEFSGSQGEKKMEICDFMQVL